MLVLARKTGESIMIGDQIELIVLSVEGETVRLGIRAPKNVEVHRKELYLSIRESNREASQTALNINEIKDIFKNQE